MAYDSWYCGLPSFVSDRIGSCVPTAQDQVTIMKSNFGPAADPSMIQQATTDYQGWLDSVQYDGTISQLKASDTTSNYLMWGVVAIGVMGMFTMIGGGGPRRYGR